MKPLQTMSYHIMNRNIVEQLTTPFPKFREGLRPSMMKGRFLIRFSRQPISLESNPWFSARIRLLDSLLQRWRGTGEGSLSAVPDTNKKSSRILTTLARLRYTLSSRMCQPLEDN